MTVRIIEGDALAELPRLASEGLQAHAVVCDPPYELGFMGHGWDRTGVAFRAETWASVRACMRPGAFLVAFSSSRTFGRMSVALEDAGFVTHPMLDWITAQGFPKATRFQQPELAGWRYGLQALKPALEPIYLGQNPLEGTGSANWEQHGCGGLNIDASRVPHAGEGEARWPANVLHDGSPEVEAAFAAFGERTSGSKSGQRTRPKFSGAYNSYAGGTERAFAGDTGSAARFFFSGKANAEDRAGSGHPTVKPASLMAWLVRLVTPPDGLVLDPFAGTGSTGLAADQLGMDAVLIERDATYAADARRKIERNGGLFMTVTAA